MYETKTGLAGMTKQKDQRSYMDRRWQLLQTRSIRFVDAAKKNTNVMNMEELKDYAKVCQGTRMYLQTKTNEYPVDVHAITGLGQCLGLYGDTLKRLHPYDQRVLFNKCVKVTARKCFYILLLDGWVYTASISEKHTNEMEEKRG